MKRQKYPSGIMGGDGAAGDGATQPNRREAVGLAGAGLALGAVLSPVASAASLPQRATVSLSEGTNIALALSPDDRTIAFDLLGLLWVMPADGGVARCITDEFADLGQPCWSPDGQRIVFQSYRTGRFQLWSVRPDGSDLRQLTNGEGDHREPHVSPDGRSILFSSDVSGRYAIHILDCATGAIRQVTQGESQDSMPCFSRDGTRIAYIADGTSLVLSDLNGVGQAQVTIPKAPDWAHPSDLHAPAFSPRGDLTYVSVIGDAATLHMGTQLVKGEDVYPFKPSWFGNGDILYASGGKIRRRDTTGASREIAFRAEAAVTTPSYRRRHRDFSSPAPRPVVGIGSPVLSPDGKRIAFRALNDLYCLTIGNPIPHRLTDGAFYKCDPAWSPDGQMLVYATDRGGTLDLWLHDMAAGTDRQLTSLPNDAATSGNWSADGKHIAFLNQAGALHQVEVATGVVERLYDPLWEPGRPSFGPDGRMIAYAAFRPSSARFREGLSEILIVERKTGKGRYTPIAPGKSIATRGDDGPVWSPDGRYLAYVFGSTLWVHPVDADGTFTGRARQITTEVTDAPSWCGDGRTLLYLSNGRLRLVPVEGGVPRTVPFRMNWAIARPPARSVVSGARVWDGLVPHYRDADVVIEGGRIAALASAGSVTAEDATRIDGSGHVLMPGLIDMHTHRQMQGFSFGDRIGRLFLAMGITATRSPGCPAYHMVEDREAIDAGKRVGPRHYATGEAIDGSRIFYNFMRPLTEPGQMALELSRAEALSYDLIKTYVRLDHRAQADAITAAHRMGVHVTSHYHYPALLNGADATEHLGATNRFGYSRTMTALGAGYDDVNGLFAAARAGRTPTLFSANILLADYPELVTDRRVEGLLPPWEYASLKTKAALMAGSARRPLLAELEKNVRQIRDMMALGWHVHSGTDAPIDTVAVSLHLNLRGMVRFGISPYETLLTSTRHAGQFLHEPVGTIARGQLADLILVDGDPLAKIEDVANVRWSMVGGALSDTGTLLEPFEDRRASKAASPVARDRLADGPGFYWQTAEYIEECRTACCAGHSIAV